MSKQLMKPITVKGYAVAEPTETQKFLLKPIEQQVNSLGENDIFVDIIASSICYGAFHHVGNIPGHEIVGIVRHVGERVEKDGKIAVGMRVGMGWNYSSCLECGSCKHHFENLCDSSKPFMNAPIGGGFQNGVVWDSRFVYPIPEKLKSVDAAPLFCAGAAVFSPLKLYRESPYSKPNEFKVAVLGLGGLGHLALQFASKMGFHVTALSTSANKEEECRLFGANDFHVHTNENSVKQLNSNFDLILNCVSTDIDTDKFVKMLKPFGKLAIIGVPSSGSIKAGAFAMIMKNRSIVGSGGASNDQIREMLNFAAEHNIKPQIELSSLEKVNEAMEKVVKNQARYRIVMVVDKEIVDKENQ
ncbi:predicted protein [Naegleria gruberi]|uniref:Predicted protein n=1 Tax=Naegleria gruberi TaxID=5762 RepID=D2VQ01_NAEGR|nr:uncharacterized protein NAEGRDRAFT_71114 [Naegleria gruberi]EFC41022.1 predicted protein [Naegleria gruberi]|eukprot:XP_002673766.1 predicted protein [Naegleria gruberi strain NEG-M]